MQRRASAAFLVAASLGLAGLARASIWITDEPVRPALRIDAKGTAEVSWRQSGARQTVIVPARGQLYHGGSLSGPDVSRPAQVAGLPHALVVRRTPDGLLYALQAWQEKPGAPTDIHLVRWRGGLTELTLTRDGDRLAGKASFQGKPVTGHTFTLEGKRPRIYVFLECFACPAAAGGGWAPMLGVAPRADGSFRVLLRPTWVGKRYRAKVAGPNVGTTFAPDAEVVVSAG